ncbi:MAG: sensor domain-containing diguanylate cyclase [Solirubrobacteraceae bacterium]
MITDGAARRSGHYAWFVVAGCAPLPDGCGTNGERAALDGSDQLDVRLESAGLRLTHDSAQEVGTGRSGADAHLGAEDYRAMYDHSPDGVLFTSPDGWILAANPAACEILARSEQEICRLGRQGLMDPDDARWGPLLAERAQTGRVRGVARMVRGDGAKIEVEMSARIFRDGRGQERSCTIMTDVTERIRMERELVELSERLRTLSVTDELTGLHNRRGFLTVARQVLEIASRQGAPVAILFADIDNLKAINDGYGHDSGDAVIRAVAEALRHELRSADTVARIGGDEFAALGLGLGDAELRSVEQRIRGRLRLTQTDAEFEGAVSVGWTVRPAETTLRIEQLLADADRAMYREKTTNR